MNFNRYLVTGASGFLGRTVVNELLKKGAEIRALVLPGDPLARFLPPEVSVFEGDICDPSSLFSFFADADSETCLIHCAGRVSIVSRPDASLYRINVGGTRNILWWCSHRPIGRLIYVSSVHALAAPPENGLVPESAVFSPDSIRDMYGKSKAAATRDIYAAARLGLNACAVFPSGLIGPGDLGKGSITQMLLSLLSGKLSFAVNGGFDFVDVRDVAAGISACAEHGLSGQGYLLTGEYVSVRILLEMAREGLSPRRRIPCLPLPLARAAAPLWEQWCLLRHRPLYFSPCAARTLSSGAGFSHRAASETFGYAPRRICESVRDTVRWLRESPDFPTVPRHNPGGS